VQKDRPFACQALRQRPKANRNPQATQKESFTPDTISPESWRISSIPLGKIETAEKQKSPANQAGLNSFRKTTLPATPLFGRL
jgi:hypothetical protein